MLPRASLSFTIPSIHDQTNLDCRVFHPTRLTNPSPSDPRWNRHIAIVAHPYAPLGGCFDDPIVDLVGGTLLHLGFMVATFNFRFVSPATAPVRTPAVPMTLHDRPCCPTCANMVAAARVLQRSIIIIGRAHFMDV